MKPHLIAAIAAPLIYASCGAHEQHVSPASLPSISVATVAVQKETVPIVDDVVGTVTARQQAAVSAKVTGRLVSTLASAGKRVTKGEVLAEIAVDEVNASLDRAKASLKQADADLARFQRLLTQNAVTQSEFDRIQAQRTMAAASVRELESVLNQATVQAPFDGIIVRKLLEQGDLATPGQALFVIEDSGPPRLEINVAESLLRTITIGGSVPVEIGDVSINSTVSEITPSADHTSRTFLIKLDLPITPTVKVGQFGRAHVTRGKREAFFVPEAAILKRGQMDYVFLAEGNVARLRLVSLGSSDAGRVEVLAGLSAGETVIVAPPSTLRDNQPITSKP